MTDFSISIETLVLDGSEIESTDAQRLAQSTQDAMQRLIEQKGPPVGLPGGDVAVVEAPTMHLSTASTDEAAQELAFALYQALGRMR